MTNNWYINRDTNGPELSYLVQGQFRAELVTYFFRKTKL